MKMKAILTAACMLLTLQLASASSVSNLASKVPARVKKKLQIHIKKIKKVCHSTGTVGTGANQITLTASAPTCKEATAMVRAAM
jgi:hypothetical protein